MSATDETSSEGEAAPARGASSDLLLEVHEVGVRFGGVVALDSLSFAIDEGTICALIGPNGAGKTTLFNVISRLYPATSGAVTFAGRNLLRVPPHGIARAGIARTFQNVALFPGLSVLDNVRLGSHTEGKVGFAQGLLGLGRAESRRLEAEAQALLDRLELGHLAHLPAAGLPFGTLKRIELARALAARPRLLMLDEPAAGLSAAEADHVRDTIRKVRDRGISLVVIDHNMRFMADLCERILVVHHGQELAHGTPQDVLTHPAVIEAYLGRKYVRA